MVRGEGLLGSDNSPGGKIIFRSRVNWGLMLQFRARDGMDERDRAGTVQSTEYVVPLLLVYSYE